MADSPHTDSTSTRRRRLLASLLDRSPYAGTLIPKLPAIERISRDNRQINDILHRLEEDCDGETRQQLVRQVPRAELRTMLYFFEFLYFASDDFASTCLPGCPPAHPPTRSSDDHRDR